MSNYDDDWLGYCKAGGYRDDPVLRHAFENIAFEWSDTPIENSRERKFMGDADDAIGIEGGISANVFGPRGRVGAISVAGAIDPDMDLALERVVARASIAHLRVLALETDALKQSIVLTPMERRVFPWLSTQLTVPQIAMRPGMPAASTVKTHVDNIIGKTGMRTRMGAVCRGIISGHIGLPDYDPKD